MRTTGREHSLTSAAHVSFRPLKRWWPPGPQLTMPNTFLVQCSLKQSGRVPRPSRLGKIQRRHRRSTTANFKNSSGIRPFAKNSLDRSRPIVLRLHRGTPGRKCRNPLFWFARFSRHVHYSQLRRYRKSVCEWGGRSVSFCPEILPQPLDSLCAQESVWSLHTDGG
jgi:hypothetical protein